MLPRVLTNPSPATHLARLKKLSATKPLPESCIQNPPLQAVDNNFSPEMQGKHGHQTVRTGKKTLWQGFRLVKHPTSPTATPAEAGVTVDES
jgi:hypothetical protein